MKSTKTRIMLGLAGMLLAAVPALAQNAGGLEGVRDAQGLKDSSLQESILTLADSSLTDSTLKDSAFKDSALKDNYWEQRPHRRSYDRRNELRLWLGGFRPDATGQYWSDVKRDFTFSNSDLEDVIFGADYILHITPNVGLIFSGSYYQGSSTQAYRNFTDQNGAAIRHDTALDISTFTAGVIFHLLPQTPVDPYIGGGGGIFAYRLREDGDFIDFSQHNLPVFTDRLVSDGTAFGYFVLAGVDFRVSHWVSLFVEGRLSGANKNLTGDFQGAGKINLDGKQIAGGISWHL